MFTMTEVNALISRILREQSCEVVEIEPRYSESGIAQEIAKQRKASRDREERERLGVLSEDYKRRRYRH